MTEGARPRSRTRTWCRWNRPQWRRASPHRGLTCAHPHRAAGGGIRDRDAAPGRPASEAVSCATSGERALDGLRCGDERRRSSPRHVARVGPRGVNAVGACADGLRATAAAPVAVMPTADGAAASRASGRTSTGSGNGSSRKHGSTNGTPWGRGGAPAQQQRPAPSGFCLRQLLRSGNPTGRTTANLAPAARASGPVTQRTRSILFLRLARLTQSISMAFGKKHRGAVSHETVRRNHSQDSQPLCQRGVDHRECFRVDYHSRPPRGVAANPVGGDKPRPKTSWHRRRPSQRRVETNDVASQAGRATSRLLPLEPVTW